MNFQYASDLHIDNWPLGYNFCNFLTPVAPFLVLAGDVCSAHDPRFIAFLTWVSRHWYLVFFVPGNHEYHNNDGISIDETDERMASICWKLGNIIFLQNGASFNIPNTNIRVVGATLWSNIDKARWMDAAEKKSDYKKIYAAPYRLLTPAETTKLHHIHVCSLARACVPRDYNEQIIVVTHHMPSKALLEPEYRGEAWHTFYASDNDFLFNSSMKAWFCGHSHRATRLQVPCGPLLAMNARGYNRDDELARTVDVYNPCAFLSLKK
jgi:hypothetical protein